MDSESCLDAIHTYEKGRAILNAFKAEGLKPYQITALLMLYEKRSCSRQDLKKLIDMKNEGAFTNRVLVPLQGRELIVVEDAKLFCPKPVYISEKGENLVEKVMEEKIYQNGKRN